MTRDEKAEERLLRLSSAIDETWAELNELYKNRPSENFNAVDRLAQRKIACATKAFERAYDEWYEQNHGD